MKRFAHIIALSALLASLFTSISPQPARAASGATLTVTTTADTDALDGNCSLREAITAANSDADYKECTSTDVYGDESIDFNISGNPTITLSSALPNINSNITIDGFNNGNKIVIDGNDLYRPFYVSPIGTLSLTDMTLQNGYINVGNGGGAITNEGGNLTVTKVSFIGNVTTNNGGAVLTFSAGTTFINRSSFYQNEAGADGGAISNLGLPVTTTTTISNSTIFENTASAAGGISNNAGTLYIYNSTISNNSASSSPGSVGSWNGTGNPANDPITEIYNSILVNSTQDTGSTPSANDCHLPYGTVAGSNNIIEAASANCSTIVLSSVDPGLGDPTGNPAYLPFEIGSSAMDTGDNVICAAAPVNNYDQRGFTRPADGNWDSASTCDIGAFEFAPKLYVDDSATSGLSNGTDWANAYLTLQSALKIATSQTVVWVAAGVYYPDEGGDAIDNDPLSTFNLPNGVAIFGGFNGTETALNQRDVKTNLTILSGDIGKDDLDVDGNKIAEIYTDIQNNNAYHVVTANGVNGNTVLDGFIITAGQADGTAPHHVGGGMFIHTGATPTLENLTFYGNLANNGSNGLGGGMYMEGNSAPSFKNGYFNGNGAYVGGGALFVDNSAPIIEAVTIENNAAPYGGGVEYYNGSGGTFTNSTIFNNEATTGNGGGFYNADSSPTLRNVTISHNKAQGTNGGGFHNIDTDTFATPAKPILLNTIIANSVSGGDCVTSTVGSGTDASLDASSASNLIEDSANACGLSNGVNGNKVGVDPALALPANNGGYAPTMRLQPASPAVDAGSNTSCASLDQRGNSRALSVSDPCDMGAYELQKGSVTFYSTASQDGWILESGENTNAGGTLDKNAQTLNIGDDASDRQYRSVLSFNTAAIDDTAVVYKVTLKLKRSGTPTGGGNPISKLGGFMVIVKNGTFGTSALAKGDFKAAGSKTVGPIASALQNIFSLNLNSASTFINKTGLTQIRLQFKKDDNDNNLANILKVYSGNTGTAASKPQLIVDYYIP